MVTVGGAITPTPSPELLTYVESRSGQKVMNCYQCGKCSAGCPSAFAMDLTPRQIMRAVQLGLKDEALQSSTIWICLFCQTCSVRCPAQIEVARVIESLRLLAVAEKASPAEKDVKLYHQIFLKSVQLTGRLYEVGLTAGYNMLSRHFFAGMNQSPALLTKGKLAMLPPFGKGTGEVEEIFARLEVSNKSSTK